MILKEELIMLKMLKAVVVDRNGNKTTVKTYAQDTHKT